MLQCDNTCCPHKIRLLLVKIISVQLLHQCLGLWLYIEKKNEMLLQMTLNRNALVAHTLWSIPRELVIAMVECSNWPWLCPCNCFFCEWRRRLQRWEWVASIVSTWIQVNYWIALGNALPTKLYCKMKGGQQITCFIRALRLKLKPFHIFLTTGFLNSTTKPEYVVCIPLVLSVTCHCEETEAFGHRYEHRTHHACEMCCSDLVYSYSKDATVQQSRNYKEVKAVRTHVLQLVKQVTRRSPRKASWYAWFGLERKEKPSKACILLHVAGNDIGKYYHQITV